VAFVRTKRVGNYEYYQLVESVRIDGKPRQKVLIHLDGHPTVEDALKKWPREIRKLKHDAARERESAARLPETGRHRRDMLRRATSAEKRAADLEANLKKLRELRKQDVL
jgi:ribosomal protein L15E